MPNGAGSKPAPTNSPVDDIGWLETALFAPPSALIARSQRNAAASTDITWMALPMRGATRRLVPTSKRFAAEAFSNQHDAMSTARRVVGRLTRNAARAGALRFAPKLGADAGLVLGDPHRSVVAAAGQALGISIASCAITLGPRRYNRKPVVQLMDEAATTVGFLKVGADAMTSAMVATEAAAIERLTRPTSPVLEVPSVLWRSEWNGHAVACFSPVKSTVKTHDRSLAPADDNRLAKVAAAVVEAGGGHRDVAINDCGPVERLRAAALASSRSDLQQLLDRVEAALGDRVVALGSWHGDFSPWNMISTAHSTALIDWEFAGDTMPVGADLLHHHVMVSTHLGGESPQAALQRLFDLGHNIPQLQAAGLASDRHRPHLLLYLLELIRRDVELNRADLPLTDFGAPATAVMEALLTEVENR